MDPNQVLADLRAAIEAWDDHKAADGNGPCDQAIDAADRMRSAAGALDDWLSADGFLPSDWRAQEDAPGTLTVRFGDFDGQEVTYTRV